MASLDLRRVLSGWPHEPNQITVRKITGDDGSMKIQMRLPLGLLQMEVSGRPDGLRPHGFESLLEYHRGRVAEHVRKNGTELGLELTSDECQALRDEAVLYYHRYLAEFVLEEFGGVERDTARNIEVMDLCRRFAREESDRVVLEQYRAYLVMMNTRARVHLALREGALRTALACVDSGLRKIKHALAEAGQAELYDELTEASILRSLREEILARLPADPLEKLRRELQRAVKDERYEDAATLRDRMAAMKKSRPRPRTSRRRKE